MSYPRIYNAAVDMVDRNVDQGRASKPVFIDANETLTYGELQARCNRMANLLATYAIPREARDFPAGATGANSSRHQCDVSFVAAMRGAFPV